MQATRPNSRLFCLLALTIARGAQAQDYGSINTFALSNDSGFNNFFARLDLPIQLTSSATLTPYIATSVAIDWLEDAGESDYFWGGVSLSVDF